MKNKVSDRKSLQKHPLDRKFSSIEEAGKAKTDHLLKEVLKGYDLNKLKR